MPDRLSMIHPPSFPLALPQASPQFLVNDIKASQDGLESRDVWGELSVDEDFVRPLCRRSMGFHTLERYDSLVAEDPPRRPKWCAMADILSVQHDRPAVSEIKLDHVPGALAANLEPNNLCQAIRPHICRQFLQKVGTDAGEVVGGSTLDVFVSDEAIPVDELEDTAMHLGEVDSF